MLCLRNHSSHKSTFIQFFDPVVTAFDGTSAHPMPTPRSGRGFRRGLPPPSLPLHPAAACARRAGRRARATDKPRSHRVPPHRRETNSPRWVAARYRRLRSMLRLHAPALQCVCPPSLTSLNALTIVSPLGSHWTCAPSRHPRRGSAPKRHPHRETTTRPRPLRHASARSSADTFCDDFTQVTAIRR